MNKAILIGRLVKDPELRYTSNNVPCTTFTIAIKRYTSDESDFIPVVVWQKTAENCHKYTKKGSQVAVLGRIQTRNYETKNGERKYVTEVIAEQVRFLDTQNKNNISEKKENIEKTNDNPFEEFANEIENIETPF